MKQAKSVKPVWYGERWLEYKYGKAWQTDYITLPQTCQDKCRVLTMVEATTGWLETYPVPHATARNTFLGLEKQVLWQHGTPERIESDNGTHFRNNLIDTWAKEHGVEWVYHIPYHAPASWKIEQYNGLLKTMLRAMGAWDFTPEQASNPGKLTCHLIEGCLAYFNENQQLLALYWGLACAYQATVQYSQRTVVEEGTQTAAEDTVAEIGTQTTTTVIAPVVKKKQWTRRSTGPYHQLVREEEEEEERFDQEAGPSAKKQEEGVREIRQEAETTWSLTSSKLRDIQKDYSCQPGKWTTTDEGIQYLRELAVLEVIHSDLDEEEVSKDPEDVLCMQATWRKTWLELQYELESKAAKWYATMDIANAFFSIPLAAECRPQFAFTWRGVQYTWNQLPQGWKHSPTICHGLIQTALEKSDAPEHLQYIDDIIMWGNKAEEVFEKGKRVIQILLKAGFMIKKSKVKGPAQEIQFLGIKWQDGHHHVPMDVVNKIATMSPPANKKETQAFLGLVGFWRMHIPGYSQLVSPLYRVTRKKNYFEWGLEQQQAFEQIKQEIARAVALGPVWTGLAVQNVLYTAAGEHGLTWSLWQKTAGETRGRPLGFWSWGY
ncbi:hypothetical protein GRJ2_003135600 [Grus japonensis]|uniref:ribonuclease H n=1 Tax=Grus japonensis TaxID=30415 RepID=A0ABC9YBP0_GRUJA